MRIKGNNGKPVTIYIDPDLSNPYIPAKLKREFSSQEIPTDASAVLITHNRYSHLVSALPIVLSANDPDCRLICAQDIASNLKTTGLISANKVSAI